MQSANVRLLAWCAGLAGTIVIIAWFWPADFGGTIHAVGFGGLLGWLALTLAARWLLVEVTVRPLAVFGYTLTRADAFWLGWLRSFANQLLPLSGVALYVRQVRRRTGSSWSELASLAAPQYLLASTAVGVVGLAAITINARHMGSGTLPLAAAFALLTLVSTLLADRANVLPRLLPAALAARLRRSAEAFRRLARAPGLAWQLVLLHTAVILLRGGRIGLLFVAAGTAIGWQDALLLVALTEATALIQLTPGGLGLREGAVVGTAVILGLSPETGAAVALIDRSLILAVTATLALPAAAMLRNAAND